MNVFTKIFIIILLLILFSSCYVQQGNYSSDEYMPLAVGNKWAYGFLSGNNYVFHEIVGVDTIKGNKYFKIKNWHSQGEIKEFESYHFMRTENDTLFRMVYDERKEKYYESIDAIFSLEEGEEVTIYRDLDEEQRQLPGFEFYKIKVLRKSKDTIEILSDWAHPHRKYREIYKKGVGKIYQSSGDLKLKDYKIKN